MNLCGPKALLIYSFGPGMSNYYNYCYPITCFLDADRKIQCNTKVLLGPWGESVSSAPPIVPHLSSLHPHPPWTFQ